MTLRRLEYISMPTIDLYVAVNDVNKLKRPIGIPTSRAHLSGFGTGSGTRLPARLHAFDFHRCNQQHLYRGNAVAVQHTRVTMDQRSVYTLSLFGEDRSATGGESTKQTLQDFVDFILDFHLENVFVYR